MDRAPGLSVRLKLTLSYAGFLMLAGALMLAAAWLAGQPGQSFDFLLRYVPDGEQHGPGDHEEAGVAEGELEASAQTMGSSHGRRLRSRCPVACRCGSRRRVPWR